MVTIKDLKAGQELSCHYMMDMGECFDSVRYLSIYYVISLRGMGGRVANVVADHKKLLTQ